MAFIDLGDQFIALQKGRKQHADDGRHFGFVVDDKEAAGALLVAGVTTLDGLSSTSATHGIEIVGYDNIQFTKAQNVLRGMGLTHSLRTRAQKKSWQKRAWRLSGIDYPSKFD